MPCLHDVEVQADGQFLVVQVMPTHPQRPFTLHDAADWDWVGLAPLADYCRSRASQAGSGSARGKQRAGSPDAFGQHRIGEFPIR